MTYKVYNFNGNSQITNIMGFGGEFVESFVNWEKKYIGIYNFNNVTLLIKKQHATSPVEKISIVGKEKDVECAKSSLEFLTDCKLEHI